MQFMNFNTFFEKRKLILKRGFGFKYFSPQGKMWGR